MFRFLLLFALPDEAVKLQDPRGTLRTESATESFGLSFAPYPMQNERYASQYRCSTMFSTDFALLNLSHKSGPEKTTKKHTIHTLHLFTHENNSICMHDIMNRHGHNNVRN